MLLQLITYYNNDTDQSFCKVTREVYFLEAKSLLADQVGNQYVSPEKFGKGRMEHTLKSIFVALNNPFASCHQKAFLLLCLSH